MTWLQPIEWRSFKDERIKMYNVWTQLVEVSYKGN